MQWDCFVLREISLFGRAVSRPFPEHAILLFSKTEEVVHRGWDTGRKRIFCLGHKHKISKQIDEPKLKGNELSNWEKMLLLLLVLVCNYITEVLVYLDPSRILF